MPHWNADAFQACNRAPLSYTSSTPIDPCGRLTDTPRDNRKPSIAAANPEITNRLRQAHLDWWNSVRAEAMSIQPFIVGLPGLGPVDLTCMDWQPSRATR